MAKKHADSGERNACSNHDNRANQLNPNNDAYWKSRGYDKRPINKKPSTRKK